MNRIKIIIISLLASIIAFTAQAETPDSTPRELKFAWGANIDGNVELSGHDMSMLGLNGEFGLQYKWIRFAGASAEANIMIGNSARLYPFSMVFRTDFHQTRQLLFMDVRAGYALLIHEDETREGVPYASAGIGVTLAHGKTFSSHLIVGYSYVGQDECSVGERRRHCPGISYATMRLGLAF